MGEDIVAMIIIRNLEWAAAQDWGIALGVALRDLRAKYVYGHAHMSQTIVAIMEFLRIADEARDRRKASKVPAAGGHNLGAANQVEERIGAISGLLNDMRRGRPT